MLIIEVYCHLSVGFLGRSREESAAPGGIDLNCESRTRGSNIRLRHCKSLYNDNVSEASATLSDSSVILLQAALAGVTDAATVSACSHGTASYDNRHSYVEFV